MQLAPWRRHAKAALKPLVPAAVRRGLRRVQRDLSIEEIGIEEIGERLARVEAAFRRGEADGRAAMNRFRVRRPRSVERDPRSDAFRREQMALYVRISGRAQYGTENERSPFDLEAAKAKPFPYDTGAPEVVADQLLARAFLLRNLPIRPPARVVEFGAGWGSTTLDLLRLGYEVTAVEVDPQFVELIRHRGAAYAERLEVVQTDMLSFQCERPYDVALFFESFHHCADHRRLLRQLNNWVRPSGALLLATEPVEENVPGWGVRLDGQSVWSMRRYGWLELGFTWSYLRSALLEAGWSSELRREPAVGDIATAVIATR